MSQPTRTNQAAFDVGQMVQRMAEGYLMHMAAIQIAKSPHALVLSPFVAPARHVPEGYVFRKDGTTHVFHFTHFLGKARDAAMVDDLARVWLVGALLTIGDALADNSFFDRAPELELLRHLRNGVAHGNAFRIDNPASLNKFPAHNRLAWTRSDTNALFEITPHLQGQTVLFDFMGPGDILDLLYSVSLYLTRMGNGDSLRP
jgi:hypothetical protein